MMTKEEENYKNELIECILKTETALAESKEVIDAYQGIEVTDDDPIWELVEQTKQMIKNDLQLRQILFEQYGIYVFSGTYLGTEKEDLWK